VATTEVNWWPEKGCAGEESYSNNLEKRIKGKKNYMQPLKPFIAVIKRYNPPDTFPFFFFFIFFYEQWG
jgi:hypothetical protein